MEKIKVGISVGDINGIGLEVILKTFEHPSMLKICTPIIYASSKIVSYHKNIISTSELNLTSIRSADQAEAEKLNVLNCWQENVNITLGKITDLGGKYAFKSIEKAVADLKSGQIDALVTAPIHKKAMELGGFTHVGHTEYLTEQFGVKESLMLMVQDTLRVGLVTNHLPVSQVSKHITRENIIAKINIFNETLKIDFGIEKPKIAVLGLNPHAGDDGVIGDEEAKIIEPTLKFLKEKGIFAFGAFPADGFFGNGDYKKYDGILAMYHDQGLVPFKTLAFGGGVNYTAGLGAVRTSPDHGTAFDIAGQNMADPSSFRQAIFTAIDIAQSRKSHAEMTANPLKRKSDKFINVEDEVIVEE